MLNNNIHWPTFRPWIAKLMEDRYNSIPRNSAGMLEPIQYGRFLRGLEQLAVSRTDLGENRYHLNFEDMSYVLFWDGEIIFCLPDPP